MSDRHTKIKTALVTYFPMFIATLSLVTAIFNGYLNNRFIDIIQRNVGRTEYMRTCKEIIDAYFQVKFRTGLVNAGGERADSSVRNEARNAVSKFAALGTYLANLRDEAIRERYTRLSMELEAIADKAAQTPAAQFNGMFENADRMFAELNDDCVRSAKAAPM